MASYSLIRDLIVVPAIGLLSGVAANWLEPKLTKFKFLTITILVSLLVYAVVFLNNPDPPQVPLLKGQRSEIKQEKVRDKKIQAILSDTSNFRYPPQSAETVRTRRFTSKATDKKQQSESEPNFELKTFLLGNTLWVARNLDVRVPESLAYDNNDNNVNYSGRLYNENSSEAACKSLGKGWRLPTSKEFEALLMKNNGGYNSAVGGPMPGMGGAMPVGNPKQGYLNLSQDTGFNLVLGGFVLKTWLNTNFIGMYSSTLFWTADIVQGEKLFTIYVIDSKDEAITKAPYLNPTITLFGACRCVLVK